MAQSTLLRSQMGDLLKCRYRRRNSMGLFQKTTKTIVCMFSIMTIFACTNEAQDLGREDEVSDTSKLEHMELAATNLNADRSAHTATLLTDGRVLVVGGSTDARAEILDQNGTNPQFSGALATNRLNQAAVLLQNGSVWVVGGQPQGGGDYLASTELFDPTTGIFSAGPSLSTARKVPTLNLLHNGKVLICGGQSDFSTYLDTCELYDPTAETITLVPGTMQHARAGHTTVLLQDGDVLICGGLEAQNTPVASCDTYNVETNTFTAVQPMNEARASHTATILMYAWESPYHRVLVVGGRSSSMALASSEIYDPETNTWSEGGSLFQARYLHSASLLPDKCIAITGGYSGSAALDSTEIYCPELLLPCLQILPLEDVSCLWGLGICPGINFGDTAPNTPVTRTLSLSNCGDMPLNISSMSWGPASPNNIERPFQEVNPFPNLILQRGETYEIDITFLPVTENALYTSSILFYSNAEKYLWDDEYTPDGSPASWSVEGSCTAAK